MKIPTDMIQTEWPGLQNEEAIDMIFSRIKWESSDEDENDLKLRIATENNLDCIFKICKSKNSRNLQESDRRYLKLISVCKIDNLYTDMNKQDSHHFFYEPFYVPPKDVVERLIRINQNYKVTIQHAINQGKCSKLEDYQEMVLELIHSVDYMQPWGELESEFAVEKSYTWLDWIIMNQMLK